MSEPGCARASLHLENKGRRVVVDNDGPATHAELTVSGPDGEVSLGQVLLPSGQGVAELDLPDAALLLPAPDGLGGWYRAPVRVTLEGKDLTGAGIAALEWRSGSAGAWRTYAAPFTHATEGATTLEYRAVDGDGRASRPKAAEVKVDTRAPIIGLGAERTVTRTTVLSPELLASDPVPGSGLASSSGALDGVPLPATGTVDLFWLPLGAHQLTASASDVAGWTTNATQELSLTATLASLEETVRELRRRGELTSDAVQESFLYSIRKAREAQDRAARSSWLTSWVHELEAKARLDALLLKLATQRGWKLSARGADLLSGDVREVKGAL